MHIKSSVSFPQISSFITSQQTCGIGKNWKDKYSTFVSFFIQSYYSSLEQDMGDQTGVLVFGSFQKPSDGKSDFWCVSAKASRDNKNNISTSLRQIIIYPELLKLVIYNIHIWSWLTT